MTTLKESITTIQKSLESAIIGLKDLEQVADKIELALNGSDSTPAKKPRAKGTLSRGKKKTSAKKETSTHSVLKLIETSKEGISVEGIVEKTGFDKRKVYSILARAKKSDKIKSPKRGFYQQAA